MRFDDAIKKVIATNVTLFEHLMMHFAAQGGDQSGFLASLCKVGYQNNYYIGKTLEDMEFLPGDEEAATAEQTLIGPATENISEATPKSIKAAQTEEEKSQAEFLKIVNTPDYPIIDMKGKISGEPKQSEGTPGEIGSTDWYRKLFNVSGESLPKQDDQGTNSPEGGAGEAGQ